VDRADFHHVTVPEEIVDRLVSYFELLLHWNDTINLTALGDTAEGIDRLLIEPVSAARHLPRGRRLLDLGSGGGSPAVPLALATAAAWLAMVDSRIRKAAFLREVIRQLDLTAEVRTERVEELCATDQFRGTWGVVSARGVRMDASMFAAASDALEPSGVIALFVSKPPVLPNGYRARSPIPLLRQIESDLIIISRPGSVPRGT
jgi:16S rRNA (guanine527-N7)-methyltransferase